MKKRLLFCLLSIVAFVATGLTASAGEKPLLGSGKWYRLVTKCPATYGDRVGKCIELLQEGSSIIAPNADKNAAANRLWSALPVDGNDYQYWQFELDPNGSGKYAMVCKAKPSGSLNPVPSRPSGDQSASNLWRWDYDDATKHYDFEPKHDHAAFASEINTYTIPVPSNQTKFMCLAAGGQKNAIMVLDHDNLAFTCEWKLVADPSPEVDVTFEYRDETGAFIAQSSSVTVPIGEEYTVAWPANDINAQFYTLVSSTKANGDVLTPTEDMTLTAVYHTDAINGVKEMAGVVSQVEAGKSYLIYDANTGNGRNCFRYVNSSTNQVWGVHSTFLRNGDPYFVWTLEAAENGYYIKNNGAGMSMEALSRDVHVGANPDVYRIGAHATAGYMAITGSDGQSWDGEGAPNYPLVGWSGGHPMQFMEYYAQPYFTVTVNTVRVDPQGNALDEVVASAKYVVKAGEAFELPAHEPTIAGEGYADNEYMNTTGDDAYLDNVNRHMVVNNNYNVRTGVEGIAAEGKAKVVYDLMGRKLNDATTPGIYVINGKKVVVK